MREMSPPTADDNNENGRLLGWLDSCEEQPGRSGPKESSPHVVARLQLARHHKIAPHRTTLLHCAPHPADAKCPTGRTKVVTVAEAMASTMRAANSKIQKQKRSRNVCRMPNRRRAKLCCHNTVEKLAVHTGYLGLNECAIIRVTNNSKV